MMRVREMRMLVKHWLVLVQMAMRFSRRIGLRVLVLMVLIMNVVVFMRQLVVQVFMIVIFTEV